MTPREEAANIIARIRSALANDHRRRAHGLLALVLRRHPPERDALLLHTMCGQAALSMNPTGQLIIRTKGDPALARYLVKVLDGDGAWDIRQRGWRIPADLAGSALARIIADRTPVRETGTVRHPSSAPKPEPIVLHCPFGIATGERLGDDVRLRITDARLRAAIDGSRPCGAYDEGRSIGVWRFGSDDLEAVRAWAERLV